MLRTIMFAAVALYPSSAVLLADRYPHEHKAASSGPVQTHDASHAAQEPVPDDINIIVVGKRIADDHRPRKIPPHCVKRSGDPADLVRVDASIMGQRVIAPDSHGVLQWGSDREPVLGPDVWQRAGSGIGQYVFRVPGGNLPMCIGALSGNPAGWGQLRQIIRATPQMRGKYLHFSMLVAARDAKLIRFWVAAGGNGGRAMGGDTSTAPLSGTFGWKRADIIVGPVPASADHVSYGFLLWGKGDVWVVDPSLSLKTRDEVRNIPTLPVSFRRPFNEQNQF